MASGRGFIIGARSRKVYTCFVFVFFFLVFFFLSPTFISIIKKPCTDEKKPQRETRDTEGRRPGYPWGDRCTYEYNRNSSQRSVNVYRQVRASKDKIMWRGGAYRHCIMVNFFDYRIKIVGKEIR